MHSFLFHFLWIIPDCLVAFPDREATWHMQITCTTLFCIQDFQVGYFKTYRLSSQDDYSRIDDIFLPNTFLPCVWWEKSDEVKNISYTPISVKNVFLIVE